MYNIDSLHIKQLFVMIVMIMTYDNPKLKISEIRIF